MPPGSGTAPGATVRDDIRRTAAQRTVPIGHGGTTPDVRTVRGSTVRSIDVRASVASTGSVQRRPSVHALVVIPAIAVIVAMAVVVSHSAAEALRESAKESAVQNIEAIVRGYLDPNLSEASLDLEAPRDPDIDSQLERLTLSGELRRVNIWSRDGRIVYSSEPELRGHRFSIGPLLGSAYAGEGVARVVLPRQQRADLERLDGLLDPLELDVGLGEDLGVVRLSPELDEDPDVVDALPEADDAFGLGLQDRQPPGDLLGMCLVVPEIGCGHLLLELGDLCPHRVEVENGLDRRHRRVEGLDCCVEISSCHDLEPTRRTLAR